MRGESNSAKSQSLLFQAETLYVLEAQSSQSRETTPKVNCTLSQNLTLAKVSAWTLLRVVGQSQQKVVLYAVTKVAATVSRYSQWLHLPTRTGDKNSPGGQIHSHIL